MERPRTRRASIGAHDADPLNCNRTQTMPLARNKHKARKRQVAHSFRETVRFWK